ncbi:hypothetical protein PtB15_11B398 [Puccinia triticina]|nr:hypothetical protein PtB15_11B398 [Puccinia triticina]
MDCHLRAVAAGFHLVPIQNTLHRLMIAGRPSATANLAPEHPPANLCLRRSKASKDRLALRTRLVIT